MPWLTTVLLVRVRRGSTIHDSLSIVADTKARSAVERTAKGTGQASQGARRLLAASALQEEEQRLTTGRASCVYCPRSFHACKEQAFVYWRLPHLNSIAARLTASQSPVPTAENNEALLMCARNIKHRTLASTLRRPSFRFGKPAKARNVAIGGLPPHDSTSPQHRKQSMSMLPLEQASATSIPLAEPIARCEQAKCRASKYTCTHVVC